MEATRLDRIVYTSEAEIADKVVNQEFWRESLFNCEHIHFDKQLVLYIIIYCEEVTQNDEMTSLMAKSF